MSIGRPEDLLEILALVVVADNRVFEQEIDAFVNAAQSLEIRSEDGSLRTRQWLFDWFHNRYKSLQKEKQSIDLSDHWSRMLKKLKEADNREQILERMNEISKADGYFHINEKLLIALAAGMWGSPTPRKNESESKRVVPV